MDADEQRMILPKHRAELGRDSLRQKNRNPRADAEELDVRNGAQLAQQVFELVIAEQQRVAAAQQHVADGGVAADVINLLVELRMEIIAGGIADESRPRAIPAISRAANGNQE